MHFRMYRVNQTIKMNTLEMLKKITIKQKVKIKKEKLVPEVSKLRKISREKGTR